MQRLLPGQKNASEGVNAVPGVAACIAASHAGKNTFEKTPDPCAKEKGMNVNLFKNFKKVAVANSKWVKEILEQPLAWSASKPHAQPFCMDRCSGDAAMPFCDVLCNCQDQIKRVLARHNLSALTLSFVGCSRFLGSGQCAFSKHTCNIRLQKKNQA